MKILNTWATALALVVSAGWAQATLTDLGDGTVLDTDTNVVWLKDWSLVGIHSYVAMVNTIDALVAAGHDNWVMPTMADYGQLRADAGGSFAGVAASFTVTSNLNWGNPTGFPSIFELGSGISYRNREIDNYGAGARLDQLYVASSVPEPQSLALVLLALGAAAVAARRRRA